MVKLLLKEKPDLIIKVSEGNDALYTATEIGYSKIVRVLLENGADANTMGKLVFPLIHYL